MRGFFLRWFLNTVALWVVSELYGGLSFAPGSDFADYLVAGLILGLVNALVKPFLLLFTLPINLLTLGLFTLVINAVVLELVAMSTALEVQGFTAAIIGALLLSLVGWGLNLLMGDG